METKRTGVRVVAVAVGILAALLLAQPAAASPDFQLTIDPATQALPPGGSVSFLVRTASVDGFDSNVTLSLAPLPAGITHHFSKTTLAPNDSAHLTLVAAADAAIGTFAVAVTGTAGGIAHTTTSTATVNFGLVPVCRGTFAGRVTDRETGAPIVGAAVHGPGSATTNANGEFTLANVSLGTNNAPRLYSIGAQKDPDYWHATRQAIAICDQVVEVDISLLRKVPGTLAGRIFEGTPDPANRNRVILGTTPIAGASVTGQSLNTTSSADGAYGPATVQVNHDNAPLNSFVTARKDGYWQNSEPITVRSGEHTTRDVGIVRKCFGSIDGVVVFEDGTPAPGVSVTAFNGSIGYTTTADDQGRFSFGAVQLAHNNGPTTYSVQSNKTGYFTASDTAAIPTCGAHDPTPRLVLRPVPVNVPNYGDLEGYVRDEETGAPIGNACVGFGSTCFVRTDANGYYRWTRIQVSSNSSRTETTLNFASSHVDYWSSPSIQVKIVADQTARQDFVLLRQRFGKVRVTVLDTSTKLPIQGAGVGLGAPPTDAAGTTLSPNLVLSHRNTERLTSLAVSATGYWSRVISGVPLRADTITPVTVELTPVCKGAVIVGTVVDATTGLPIANANVSGGLRSARTNAAGEYRLENISVGNQNSPINVNVTASHPSYYTQTKTVTAFCGATISLSFGQQQEATGNVEGFVRNTVTGQPIANAFIGTGWGGSTTTNAQGYYKLTGVPLNADLSDRVWSVTADPVDFEQATREFTAKANVTSRLDFEFGNRPPVAPDRSLATNENEPLAITLGADDPDGDSTTCVVVAEPARGTLTGTAPAYTYTPNANYYGEDSFTYRCRDGLADSNVATVSIAVRPVNDAPLAVDDAATTDEDVPVTIPVFVLLGNDVDMDGDVLTVTAVAGGAATHGSVELDGLLVRYTPDENYNGPATFTYEVRDGNGDTATASVDVEVLPVNDPPAAAITGGDAFVEGGSTTLTGTGTDVDGDPLTYSWQETACGALLTSLAGSATIRHLDGPTLCNVHLIVSDGTASATDEQSVDVLNADPSVDAGPDAAIDEGGTASLRGAYSDPGSVDTHSATVDWGDGTVESVGARAGVASATHVYPENGTYTVKLTVTDDDGGVGSDTMTVVVRNVAPVVDAGPDDAIDEGRSARLTGTYTDPGVLDTHVASVDWGDGTTTQPAASGGNVGASHTYLDNGTYTVTLTVSDDDGDVGSDTMTVVVRNVPPTVDAGPDQQVVEGATVSLTEATFTDPGIADTHGARVNWGDGSGWQPATIVGSTIVAEHPYGDNGTYDVTVEVTDDDGGLGTDTLTVAVRNAAPDVTAGPDRESDESASIDVNATFTDAGWLDTHTATVDFGDGTAAQQAVLNAGEVTASHVYDDNGVYTVTFTVTDDEGASGSATLVVRVRNLPPRVDAGPDKSQHWGRPVSFAGSATDPSVADTNAGLAVSWTLGDGSPAASGLAVEHVYADPGSYTATLTATDKDGGSASDTAAVEVRKRETSLEYAGAAAVPFGFGWLEARLGDAVDPASARLGGRTIVFEVGGQSWSATTNSAGVARVDAPLFQLGTFAVNVRFAEDAHYLASSATATLAVVSTPGKVTSGTLRFGTDGRGGFVVQSDGSSVNGELEFHAGAENFHAHDLTALGVSPDGRRAWFAGMGVDGRAFLAYVEDNGEPGTNDVFRIWIGGTTKNGDGSLTGGNVQIHK